MLNVKIKDIKFNNPLLTASGTFGYGDEVKSLTDLSKLGGIVTKSVTLEPREGNPPPRIYETTSGMLNSIGLANVGINTYCEQKLPFLNSLDTKIIINIAGSSLDEYVKVLEKLEESNGVHVGYEINISCPNVKKGGMQFGVDCSMTEQLTKRLREKTDKLLIMKLSPNVTSIQEIAKASENGGADAVSAINTLVGAGIDINTRKPVLNTTFGGLSGPAIKPIAIANILKISKVVSIPIIGIGGISNYKDVIEFILAGATMIQLGTINFSQPHRNEEILIQLKNWLNKNNISQIMDLKGAVECYS
ncbi:MAG: dihydroorotate dehydrogenase [Candidatus Marinimicrobia bacterium]|nr:dihydroorotate dehydrogenase [Candidatus Neomarinimicrobiota bacterium]